MRGTSIARGEARGGSARYSAPRPGEQAVLEQARPDRDVAVHLGSRTRRSCARCAPISMPMSQSRPTKRSTNAVSAASARPGSRIRTSTSECGKSCAAAVAADGEQRHPGRRRAGGPRRDAGRRSTRRVCPRSSARGVGAREERVAQRGAARASARVARASRRGRTAAGRARGVGGRPGRMRRFRAPAAAACPAETVSTS